MFRTRYIRSLMIAAAAAAALAVSCTADPADPAESTDPAEGAEPASLTINISIADLGLDVSTRAGTEPSDNTGTPTDPTRATGTPGTTLPDDDVFGSADMIDPDNLAKIEDYQGLGAADKYKFAEAALVNGSRMCNLTVLLIHRHSNRIVGVRRIPDPDCPNFTVQYEENTGGTTGTTGEAGKGNVVKYPPDVGSKEEATLKKNCIFLNEEGVFAPVLRNADGSCQTDDKGNISGLFGKYARVTFDYENPIHVDANGESAEKLLRGEYTVLAIANYDHRVTTASFAGTDQENYPTLNVDAELERITNLFHANIAKGVGPFAPVDGDIENSYSYLYNLRFLMNRTLNTAATEADGQTGQSYFVDDNVLKGADGNPLLDEQGNPRRPFIRPAVHQTLTAAKDIYLEAGQNVLNLELLRISSRTRVEVKNYGDTPLKVHKLEFSPNYTQSTCYLFRRNKENVKHELRDYSELASNTAGLYTDHDGKGAPAVEYTGIYNYFGGKTYGAIVPFVKNMTIDGEECVGVEAGKKACIFDALMYESHIDYKDDPNEPDAFTYTIDVSYPKVKDYETYDINKIDHLDASGNDDPSKYSTRPDHNKSVLEYVINPNSTNLGDHALSCPSTDQELYTSIAELEKSMDKEKDESLCFFIKGVGAYDRYRKFLCETDDGSVDPCTVDSGEIPLNAKNIDVRSFLWKMEGLRQDVNGKYYCYLTNLRTGKHMSTLPAGVEPTVSNHLMCTNDVTPLYQLGVSSIGSDEKNPVYNVTFSNTHNNVPYYLSIWGHLGLYMGGYNSADQGCQYVLYPVKSTAATIYTGTPRMKKTVELTAFSDATGYVEKVREIQRNDFIRILVEVSYNTEKGDFEFRVNPWNPGGGEVSFN